MFRRVLKKLVQVTWRPWVLHYTRKERTFRYRGLDILVRKGVFHPGFFFSSLMLLEFLEKKPLAGKKVLEPGCGTGLISVFAASRGAHVTACDISRQAVENTRLNATLNKVNIAVLESDLFGSIPADVFDFILVNPPYFRRNPRDDSERAWFAGEDLGYFKRFFMTLHPFFKDNTQVYMILSDDCEIDVIKAIAGANGYRLEEVQRKWKWWEWNIIFRVVKNS